MSNAAVETSTSSVALERPIWRDYLELCKPKVVALMMITAVVGMALAPVAQFSWLRVVAAIVGIALAAASAAAVNHTVDRKIDALMKRTHKRPIPKGRITIGQALTFATVLCAISMLLLFTLVNALTAALSFVTLVGYAGFYTLFLKRQTPQNIVIGGATGAAPPLLGWTAMSGTLDPHAWLLVLIIFVWTPPHFWALAIHRVKEYAKAGIPMLPVTHGIPYTKLCITLYTLLLIAVSLLPFVVAMSGWVYLVAALLLGLGFLYYALELQFWPQPLSPMRTFKYSSLYLLLLFLALLVDKWTLG